MSLVFTIIIFQGCYKVTTYSDTTGEEVTGSVSFSTNVVPILNSSCNASGCHNTGGIKPDLSQNNAYNSLVNGGYVNVGSPEQSEVYLWITGKKATPMPPNGPVNPFNLNQIIKAWIKQGANNN